MTLGFTLRKPHSVALQMEYIQLASIVENLEIESKADEIAKKTKPPCGVRKRRRGCRSDALIRRRRKTTAWCATLVALRVRLMACRFASFSRVRAELLDTPVEDANGDIADRRRCVCATTACLNPDGKLSTEFRRRMRAGTGVQDGRLGSRVFVLFLASWAPGALVMMRFTCLVANAKRENSSRSS